MPTWLSRMFSTSDATLTTSYEYSWIGPKEESSLFSDVTDENPRLTYVIGGGSVEALDLLIKIGPDGKLILSLYRKPAEGHQFVHYSSAHPAALKRSLPYSQLAQNIIFCLITSTMTTPSKKLQVSTSNVVTHHRLAARTPASHPAVPGSKRKDPGSASSSSTHRIWTGPSSLKAATLR